MAERKSTSTYSINEQHLIGCNLSYVVSMIAGRWKLQILSKLEERKYRFGELRSEFGVITERMLTAQLQALEKDGLIKRTVYAQVPPRVEYELTPMALELIPIFERLSEWGSRHKSLQEYKRGRSTSVQF